MRKRVRVIKFYLCYDGVPVYPLFTKKEGIRLRDGLKNLRRYKKINITVEPVQS